MIDKALKGLSEKVDEAEIFYLDSRAASVRTKKVAIDTFKEKVTRGYGIRVIHNSKMGFYFTNNLTKESLEKAVKVAKSAQEDKNLSLPLKQVYNKTPAHMFEMGVEEGIKMAEDLVSATKDYQNVYPTSGTISWGTLNITIANTNGVYGEKEESSLSAYLATVAKGEEPNTGFQFEVSRRKDIDAFEVGAAASRLAKDSLNPQRVETSKRRVILRPMAVTELIESTLIPAFSADNVQRGRSRFQGMIGEEVFSGIDIADDAILKGGLMSEEFDDEGVSAKKTVLVEGGVLKGFLYDTYTANKEGRESTGSGARSSHSSLPSVGPSNFTVSGGTVIDTEEGALIVHGLIGAHTSNPVSGDFSCETRNAFLDGVPVKKAIVTGNIFDILNSSIGFGKDLKQYSSVRSPSIELPEVMVVA